MSTVADDIYRNVLRETLDSLKVESYIDETRTETVVPDAPVEVRWTPSWGAPVLAYVSAQ